MSGLVPGKTPSVAPDPVPHTMTPGFEFSRVTPEQSDSLLKHREVGGARMLAYFERLDVLGFDTFGTISSAYDLSGGTFDVLFGIDLAKFVDLLPAALTTVLGLSANVDGKLKGSKTAQELLILHRTLSRGEYRLAKGRATEIEPGDRPVILALLKGEDIQVTGGASVTFAFEPLPVLTADLTGAAEISNRASDLKHVWGAKDNAQTGNNLLRAVLNEHQFDHAIATARAWIEHIKPGAHSATATAQPSGASKRKTQVKQVLRRIASHIRSEATGRLVEQMNAAGLDLEFDLDAIKAELDGIRKRQHAYTAASDVATRRDLINTINSSVSVRKQTLKAALVIAEAARKKEPAHTDRFAAILKLCEGIELRITEADWLIEYLSDQLNALPMRPAAGAPSTSYTLAQRQQMGLAKSIPGARIGLNIHENSQSFSARISGNLAAPSSLLELGVSGSAETTLTRKRIRFRLDSFTHFDSRRIPMQVTQDTRLNYDQWGVNFSSGFDANGFGLGKSKAFEKDKLFLCELSYASTHAVWRPQQSGKTTNLEPTISGISFGASIPIETLTEYITWCASDKTQSTDPPKVEKLLSAKTMVPDTTLRFVFANLTWLADAELHENGLLVEAAWALSTSHKLSASVDAKTIAGSETVWILEDLLSTPIFKGIKPPTQKGGSLPAELTLQSLRVRKRIRFDDDKGSDLLRLGWIQPETEVGGIVTHIAKRLSAVSSAGVALRREQRIGAEGIVDLVRVTDFPDPQSSPANTAQMPPDPTPEPKHWVGIPGVALFSQ